jgi:plasmid maintenance system antidote protein VapI
VKGKAVTSKNIQQLHKVLDKIPTDCDTCDTARLIQTLHLVLDALSQTDHRSPARWRLEHAIMSGLDVITPTDAAPPGVVLESLMKARGITIKQMASLIGRSVKAITDLRAGRSLPSESTALALERAGFGTAADWNRMSAQYKDWKLRQKDEKDE